ncbi:MAG TPA: cytochrome c [Phycisphaerales bacterium]|nr:cytochrome c [Phycisphaerales bacterium]
MNTPINTTRSLLLALAGAAALSGLAACRGDREEKPPRQFFPDMDDQPKWKPQEKSQFFPDGRTMRQPVQGAVPFGNDGWSTNPNDPNVNPFAGARAGFLKEDEGTFQGVSGKQYLPIIPVEVTEQLVHEGATNFNIYCAVCHGYTGDGKGLVGAYFTVAPVNLHDPKYKQGGEDPLNRDGYIFSVIRNGVRSMPAYGHALSEHESWGVVAYIRALQASQEGTLQDVPEAQRAALEQELNRPDPTPAPAPAAPAAGPATPQGQPTQTPAPATTGGGR